MNAPEDCLGFKIGHCGDVRRTTALAPKAEVDPRSCDVAQVPEAAVSNRSKAALFHHLVGERDGGTSSRASWQPVRR
jgi:hypothetical protein